MRELVVSSSALILILVALRFLLGGRLSARLQYALWGLAALRLLLPVSLFESSISVMKLLPDPPPAYSVSAPAALPEWDTAAPASPPVAAPDTAAPTEAGPERIAEIVWLCGALLCAGVFLAANVRLSRLLRGSRQPVIDADGCVPVYLSTLLASPCLYGFCRPAIYLTPESLLDAQRKRHILAHEQTHYRHKDHIWALVRAVCVCLHWYNPLVWLAAVLSRRDSELACDEGALRRLGDECRVAYGKTLIEMMTVPARPADLLCCSTTMGGGKHEMAERLRRIAKKKKTLLLAAVLVLLLTVAAVAATFGGNDQGEIPTEPPTPAEQLWNARTPYVGDAPAVGKLIGLLPVPEGLRYDHFQLHTSESPYDIEIFYTADDAGFAAYDRSESEVGNPFRRNALLLLALVDNADGVRATITNGERTVNFVHVRSWAEETVGGDVREYAQDAGRLQTLINLPLHTSTAYEQAEAAVKAAFPAPLLVEADGDVTVQGTSVAYSFRVSAMMAQGDDPQEQPRLIQIVAVEKSTGVIWQYNLATGEWELFAPDPGGTGNSKPVAPVIQPDVSSVKVTHRIGGSSTETVVSGQDVEALRAWLAALSYQHKSVAQGAAPGDREGGELYTFAMEEGDYPGFTYGIYGKNDCYLVVDGEWFAVVNPTDPPLGPFTVAGNVAGSSYAFERYGKDGEIIAVAALTDEALAAQIVMDVLVKSAAFPGVDLKTLEVYYLIRQTFPGSEDSQDYYAFLLEDGRAALQHGENGMYSLLSRDLYDALDQIYARAVERT